ncbi:2-hydroxy-3-oxopropionate reductase [Roseibacterium elongatum DSM 19469]|uniref:2-hydroxy-3-oxopropionate reductase n=2 Tax=Roseicyclus elongatus TaxID=159346 RepID=W8SP70_9RHOB|nr:2-hydroxy-3-oxopropionate reductase [Roseibacterium elongatum DSM 19469]
MNQIGIVGLGRMGSAIAARLAAQGHPVAGWTRSGLTPERAEALGIARAETLPDLVAASETLILSLYDDAAVAAVLDTVLGLPLDGKLIVETSTVSPQQVQSRAADVAAKGASILDAPISGGPELVAEGECGIFVGGDTAAAERFAPIGAVLSDKLAHVGPLGTGVAMKIVNNGVLQGYFATLAEMMRIAKRAGLPFETALRIIAKGPAGTPMLTARLPRMLGHEDGVGFPISGVAKDNAVFRQVATELGVEAATLALADALWQTGIADGLADADVAMQLPHAYDNA